MWEAQTLIFFHKVFDQFGFDSTSSEIPTAAPFPASPKTALWWEFLRFRAGFAALDSGPILERIHGPHLDMGRTPVVSRAVLP